MKKIIATILTCALLLCLCACNPESTESTDSVESSLETTTAATTSGESKDNITQSAPSTTLATTATTPTIATTTEKVTTKKSTTSTKAATTTKATTKKVTTTAKETTAKAPTTKPTISKEDYAKRLNFWFTGIRQVYNDNYEVGDPFDDYINFSHLTYFLAENISPKYEIQSVTIDSVIYKGEKCTIYESKKEEILIPFFGELCDWWDDVPPLDEALKTYKPLKVVIIEIKPNINDEEISLKEEDSVYTINYTITFADGDKVSLQITDNRLAIGGGGMPLSPEKLQ